MRTAICTAGLVALFWIERLIARGVTSLRHHKESFKPESQTKNALIQPRNLEAVKDLTRLCINACGMYNGRGVIPLLICLALATAAGADLRFTAANGGFEFNTGVLAGKLHGDGKSVGALPVTYLPTGAVLTQSMGLAGHYRLFSGSHRFGTGAWYWPTEAKLLDDGAAEVYWPAAEDRPFEMWAVYRWVTPSTFDVETRVRPKTELEQFELFMAWYFNGDFNISMVHTPEGFVAAEQEAGAWQLFPRDGDSARMAQDGRWDVPPNPVKWTIRPAFDQPIGVRRGKNGGITAVVMSRPEDCFAISTPHQTDPHYSLYLSLFGRTIRAGETARVRTRTVILPEATDAEIVDLYNRFKSGR
jgi:hypothetical protein